VHAPKHQLKKASGVRKIFLLLAMIFCIPLSATAASTAITEVPTNWRLENYPASAGVVVWCSSSACNNGSLTLPSGATAADQNRLWALILAAKLSGHKVFVYYENASAPTSCPILSFGMDN